MYYVNIAQSLFLRYKEKLSFSLIHSAYSVSPRHLIFFRFSIFLSTAFFFLPFKQFSTSFLPLELLYILYMIRTDEMSLIKSPALLEKPNSSSFPSLSSHVHYFSFFLAISTVRRETLVSSSLLFSQHVEQCDIYSRYSKAVLN